MSKENILLVGFGYVGQALGRRLKGKGHRLAALRRSPITLAAEEEIEMLRGDASDSTCLGALDFSPTQIVVTTSPDERSEAAYERAYPRVVEALTVAFPDARLVLVSSTSVYDQRDGQLLNEESEARATEATAGQILRAEERLLRKSGAPAHVVVRASGIYGPGRVRLVSSLLHHELTDDERDVWTSRVHRDDLAQILEFLIEKPKIGGILLGTDPTPSRLGDIADWVRANVDASTLPWVPESSKARKNRRFVPTRLTELGYQFAYPSFAHGYREIIGLVQPDP